MMVLQAYHPLMPYIYPANQSGHCCEYAVQKPWPSWGTGGRSRGYI